MHAAYSKRLALSPMPDVRQMPWQPAGHDEDCINSDVVAVAGVARHKSISGNRDAAQPVLVERPSCCFRRGALLHFDESDDPATPGDKIDFSACDTGAAGEDAPAFQSQPPGSQRLRPAASRLSLLST
jgi:hypothetical protein